MLSSLLTTVLGWYFWYTACVPQEMQFSAFETIWYSNQIVSTILSTCEFIYIRISTSKQLTIAEESAILKKWLVRVQQLSMVYIYFFSGLSSMRHKSFYAFAFIMNKNSFIDFLDVLYMLKRILKLSDSNNSSVFAHFAPGVILSLGWAIYSTLLSALSTATFYYVYDCLMGPSLSSPSPLTAVT